MAVMKANNGHTYFVQGKMDSAYQMTGEAVALAEESGDIFPKMIAYGYHGFICYGKGFLEESEKALSKSNYYNEKINSPFVEGQLPLILGEIYADMGEYGKSCDCYEKSIMAHQRGGIWPSWISLSRIALARAKVMNHERDIHLDSLYGLAAANKVNCLESWMSRHMAEILLNIDDEHLNEAEHWVQKALETDQKYGVVCQLGWDYAIYTDLYLRRGDKARAREYLGQAIEIYKECGADGWQHKAEKEFNSLS